MLYFLEPTTDKNETFIKAMKPLNLLRLLTRSKLMRKSRMVTKNTRITCITESFPNYIFWICIWREWKQNSSNFSIFNDKICAPKKKLHNFHVWWVSFSPQSAISSSVAETCCDSMFVYTIILQFHMYLPTTIGEEIRETFLLSTLCISFNSVFIWLTYTYICQ